MATRVDAYANDAWATGLILYFILTGRDGFSKDKVRKYENLELIDPYLTFKASEGVPALA